MTKSNLNVVFFGNERLSTGLSRIRPYVLPSLIEHGYQVTAVVANQESSQRSSQHVLEVEELAIKNQIPFLTPSRPLDILDQLAINDPSIGVLVAYGRIIPQALIDLFPLGIINLHPSLLPTYRGSTPIEQVILDGADNTGVSIMQLSAKMDAGPILLQKEIMLVRNEQKSYLADKLLRLGSELILASLKQVTAYSNKLIIQDESLASYTPQITKSDGLIDWSKSAQQIERQVRAYLGWPGSYAPIAHKDVTIVAAHTIPLSGKAGLTFRYEKHLAVYCGQDALIIDRLKPAGKREMSGQEFLAGNSIV